MDCLDTVLCSKIDTLNDNVVAIHDLLVAFFNSDFTHWVVVGIWAFFSLLFIKFIYKMFFGKL